MKGSRVDSLYKGAKAEVPGKAGLVFGELKPTRLRLQPKRKEERCWYKMTLEIGKGLIMYRLQIA